jgi:hypothetical protein
MDSLPVDCRLLPLTFDIASAAGWYSSIAGVLAGFALLAILLPLDHLEDDSDEATTSNAVVVFVSAFFSLLILSFAYAVLAGRSGDGDELAIAAFEQLLLGGVFGLSTLLLLVGLHAVLRSYGANRMVFASARHLIRLMTGILGPILVIALQFSSALDLARYRLGVEAAGMAACDVAGFPWSVWIDLAIVVATIVGIVLLALLRERLSTRPSAAPTAARIVLAMTFLIVLAASILVPLLPVETVTSPLLEHGALLLVAIGALVLAYATWASREAG